MSLRTYMTFFLLLNRKEDIKTITVWTKEDVLQISSLVFHRRKEIVWIWNNVKVSKWWQNFHFWVMLGQVLKVICISTKNQFFCWENEWDFTLCSPTAALFCSWKLKRLEICKMSHRTNGSVLKLRSHKGVLNKSLSNFTGSIKSQFVYLWHRGREYQERDEQVKENEHNLSPSWLFLQQMS